RATASATPPSSCGGDPIASPGRARIRSSMPRSRRNSRPFSGPNSTQRGCGPARVGRSAGERRSRARLTPEPMNPTDMVQTRALSPVPAQARRELQSLLEAAEWPGDVDGIVLAVHEALTNAQRHAGGATSATAAVQDSSSLLVE